MASDVVLQSSSQNINILVVIDTEFVKKTYGPNQLPKEQPQGISHSNQYMICTGAREIISGQGSGDLHFRANVGDMVSFAGVSIYENADDAVIVYAIKHFSGDDVFNRFQYNHIERTGAAQPNEDTADGLPASHRLQTFATYDSKVKKSGTEGFGVCFALYTLDSNGQKQNLYGYYWWDPTITVA
ncbi:inclusion body family protein [Trinickia fusca]|uniref:DNA-directed RNA polymerase subunit beta n=1 Tax=Trinickia fusca TaxID=2419777 RepID=A0A494XYG6_9BURK|nr:inclusion body family protein [Trinickia fusca]RKP52623.1 DNA-directed RNA polymerase subunit beta [Trinickia fusca]